MWIYTMCTVLAFNFFIFIFLCYFFNFWSFCLFIFRNYHFPWPKLLFHEFPSLENEIIKFRNFPCFPWPVWNMQFAVYHTLSGWVCNSFFSLSKFPCPASLIIIDPMSVELLMRRWSNKELSDWSTGKTKHGNQKLNSVLSLKVNKKSIWQRYRLTGMTVV